ncbi:cornichon protein [Ancylostoma ceylanicum]|uniref:Cornichon protein n=2 Tax=Ancylostoma TaxID=29169 RepID=A0A0D6M3T1_9BILA|nr:cornichon protein [Ancylostoma ceylanicum]
MRMLTPDILNRAAVASKAGSGMAFTFAAFAYLIALIAVAFCIFFAIYTVICIDELKTDYKNPIEQCRNLNQLILPEYAIHMTYTFLFIVSWQMFAILMNLPLTFYHIATYMRRPVISGPGIYDPTTILNRNELSASLRASWAKLAFYLLSFFYYLYAEAEAELLRTAMPVRLNITSS